MPGDSPHARDNQMPKEIRQFELACLVERAEFELQCGLGVERVATRPLWVRFGSA